MAVVVVVVRCQCYQSAVVRVVVVRCARCHAPAWNNPTTGLIEFHSRLTDTRPAKQTTVCVT